MTIAGRDTAAMTHKEAQQAILAAGDTVQLLVQRHAPAPSHAPAPVPSHAPAPGQWAPRLEADRAGMASNAEDFTREFMKQLGGAGPGSFKPRVEQVKGDPYQVSCDWSAAGHVTR